MADLQISTVSQIRKPPKSIKPIQTAYKNHLFRSRIEARWAVYFDVIGINWVYEKEGYDLGDGLYYLPDFWLPQVEMWAEVKPGKFSLLELEKAKRLVKGTGFSLIMLEGPPACRSYEVVSRYWINENDELMLGDGYDCVISNYHGYPQNENRFYSGTGWGSPFSPHGDFEHNGMFDDVPAAVKAALSARFEYGERG